jgi:hypothetical protein
MVHHLHADFLESEAAYRASQRFWRNVIDEVAKSMLQQNEWTPWEPKHFLDGTPMPRDGNPILDARSERRKRAIRVIQSPPERSDVEIAAWIDAFDFSEAGGPAFTEELVLNLSLSEESASIARQLIKSWMDESVSRERMEDFIMSLCARPQS